jgi:hypothetical protein
MVLVNQSEARKPTEPVTRKMASDSILMYPKYSR